MSAGSFATSVSLTPGEFISIGIPLRISGSCYEPGSFTGGDTFYVKKRFGIFTHWVAVPVQLPWTLYQPYYPGNRTSGLASQPLQLPAKDLICPKR